VKQEAEDGMDIPTYGMTTRHLLLLLWQMNPKSKENGEFENLESSGNRQLSEEVKIDILELMLRKQISM